MKSNQVAFIGLNNVFGRIVSSLLKQSPNINKLVLYDDRNGASVKSYINGTEENCNVTTVYGREKLPEALSNADVVIIGDELFQRPNPEDIPVIGQKAAEYAKLIAESSPNAFLVIAASPLNYVLPIFARVLEAAGCFNPRKVLGATSCDTLRASTLLSARLRLRSNQTILPVVGGGSATTRIPLFSQANYSPIKIDQETQLDIIEKLREFEGSEYTERNIMERAYASVRFANSVLAARKSSTPIPEIALTRNNEIPEVDYFSMPLLIGKEGVERIMKLPKLSAFEKEILNSAVNNLKVDIELSKNILETKEGESKKRKPQSLQNSYEGIDFLTCSNTEMEKEVKIEKTIFPPENVKTTFVKPKLDSNTLNKYKPKRRRRKTKKRKKKSNKRIKKTKEPLPKIARENLTTTVKPVQNEKLEEMSKSFEIKLNEVFSPPVVKVKKVEENAKIPPIKESNVSEILDSKEAKKSQKIKTKTSLKKIKNAKFKIKEKLDKKINSKIKNLSMTTPRKFQMKNVILKSKGPIKISIKETKNKEKIKNETADKKLQIINIKDNVIKKLENEKAGLEKLEIKEPDNKPLNKNLDLKNSVEIEIKKIENNEGVLKISKLNAQKLEEKALVEAKLEGKAPVKAKLEGKAPVEAKLEGKAPVEAKLEGKALVEAKLEGKAPVEAKLEEKAPVEAKLEEKAPVEAKLETKKAKKLENGKTPESETIKEKVLSDSNLQNVVLLDKIALEKKNVDEKLETKKEDEQLQKLEKKSQGTKIIQKLDKNKGREQTLDKLELKKDLNLQLDIKSNNQSGDKKVEGSEKLEIKKLANKGKEQKGLIEKEIETKKLDNQKLEIKKVEDDVKFENSKKIEIVQNVNSEKLLEIKTEKPKVEKSLDKEIDKTDSLKLLEETNKDNKKFGKFEKPKNDEKYAAKDKIDCKLTKDEKLKNMKIRRSIDNEIIKKAEDKLDKLETKKANEQILDEILETKEASDTKGLVVKKSTKAVDEQKLDIKRDECVQDVQKIVKNYSKFDAIKVAVNENLVHRKQSEKFIIKKDEKSVKNDFKSILKVNPIVRKENFKREKNDEVSIEAHKIVAFEKEVFCLKENKLEKKEENSIEKSPVITGKNTITFSEKLPDLKNEVNKDVKNVLKDEFQKNVGKKQNFSFSKNDKNIKNDIINKTVPKKRIDVTKKVNYGLKISKIKEKFQKNLKNLPKTLPKIEDEPRIRIKTIQNVDKKEDELILKNEIKEKKPENKDLTDVEQMKVSSVQNKSEEKEFFDQKIDALVTILKKNQDERGLERVLNKIQTEFKKNAAFVTENEIKEEKLEENEIKKSINPLGTWYEEREKKETLKLKKELKNITEPKPKEKKIIHISKKPAKTINISFVDGMKKFRPRKKDDAKMKKSYAMMSQQRRPENKKKVKKVLKLSLLGNKTKKGDKNVSKPVSKSKKAPKRPFTPYGMNRKEKYHEMKTDVENHKGKVSVLAKKIEMEKRIINIGKSNEKNSHKLSKPDIKKPEIKEEDIKTKLKEIRASIRAQNELKLMNKEKKSKPLKKGKKIQTKEIQVKSSKKDEILKVDKNDTKEEFNEKVIINEIKSEKNDKKVLNSDTPKEIEKKNLFENKTVEIKETKDISTQCSITQKEVQKPPLKPKPVKVEAKTKNEILKIEKKNKRTENVSPTRMLADPSREAKKAGPTRIWNEDTTPSTIWGRIYSIVKQIITTDLREEEEKRMRSLVHSKPRPTG